MTTIVVTGSRGMLGCHLVPYLKSCGHEVVGLSRAGDAAQLADLADPREADSVLDELDPDAIVNLAAITNVDECERNPQLAYLGNVRIVENLAAWMARRSGRCRLVQISTDQLYDGAGPHQETSVTLSNCYGFSKYAGELAAAAVGGTILRTNFFGPSKCAWRSSLSDWLIRSLTAGQPITVFDDIKFSPLSLQSLVTHIELVIRDPRIGVFNLGSSAGMSKAEFAFAVARTIGLPTGSMSVGKSDSRRNVAYRPKDMRMDSQKFEKAYGIRLPDLKQEIMSLSAEHAYKTG